MNLKKTLLVSAMSMALCTLASAADLKPLNSDTEPDRLDWSELQSKLGDMPAVKEGTRIGGGRGYREEDKGALRQGVEDPHQ